MTDIMFMATIHAWVMYHTHKYTKFFIVKYVPREPPNLIRKREIQSPIRKPLKVLVSAAAQNVRRVALRQYIASLKGREAPLAPRCLF